MRRLLVTAGLALLAVAGTAAALDARSTVSFDFGDAPDGRAAGYAGKPSVQGVFPSRAASGGPRHGAAGPRLGRSWSAEADARRTDVGDDSASLQPHSCAKSTLTMTIDVSRVPAGTPVYVNTWFDWNQDGDWADGRESAACGPEWGVQNSRVDTSKLTDKFVTLALSFRAGRVPPEFWWRVQVHTGTPVPHSAGGGQAAPTMGGETEDARYESAPPTAEGGPRALCFPRYTLFEHGRSTTLLGVIVGTGVIRVTGVSATHTGGNFVVIRRQAIRGPQSVRVEVASTQKHRIAPLFWPVEDLVVRITIAATRDGRPVSRTAACRLSITHATKVVARLSAQFVSSDAAPGRAQGCTISGSFSVRLPPRHGIANYGIDVRFPKGATVGTAKLTTAAGETPSAGALGPLLKWSEYRSRVRPDGQTHGFFVQVAYLDSNDPREPTLFLTRTWRYTVAYAPPRGSTACDAVLVG